MRIVRFRPAWIDELGLGRMSADRMVPFQVAAMAFLAALAVAGWMGAAVLTRHWDSGPDSTFTVQVPRAGEPDAAGSGTRLAAVEALLNAAPDVASTRTLSDQQLNDLLRPWLGADMKNLAVPVPSVIAVHMIGRSNQLSAMAARLDQIVPGTIVEDHAAWAGELGRFARSLQLCSELVLLVVTVVTAAVISAATRAGLLARRDAVQIVHQLGATDGYISGRFATRSVALASVGGAIGGLLALPVVFALTALSVSLAGGGSPAPTGTAASSLMPVPLWLLPVFLTVAASFIGYLTTQITMRRWLRRLT
jgi:cell division transport system permease protein